MVTEDRIVLTDSIAIPLSELEIHFVRSSGPGGQHVNKTASQAEIIFDLGASPSIPEHDRVWLQSRLANKLDSSGRLHVTSQEHRSQRQNRSAAIEKLEALLAEAIKRPKKRKKTKPTKASVERRLTTKKKASEKKKSRNERY
jgi:ribosome-associated protein